MTKRELKALIKEAVMECLPDIVESITECINVDNKQVIENKMPSITSKYKRADNHGYDDMPTLTSGERVTPKKDIASEQKKIVEEGGIMGWYRNGGGKTQPKSEFKHTNKDMNDFMKRKFGV